MSKSPMAEVVYLLGHMTLPARRAVSVLAYVFRDGLSAAGVREDQVDDRPRDRPVSWLQRAVVASRAGSATWYLNDPSSLRHEATEPLMSRPRSRRLAISGRRSGGPAEADLRALVAGVCRSEDCPKLAVNQLSGVSRVPFGPCGEVDRRFD